MLVMLFCVGVTRCAYIPNDLEDIALYSSVAPFLESISKVLKDF